jgi:hypothetical protein
VLGSRYLFWSGLLPVKQTFLSDFLFQGREMTRSCENSADNFCGEVILVPRKCVLTPVIKRAYFLHFGFEVGD